jgi:hypothetical protein
MVRRVLPLGLTLLVGSAGCVGLENWRKQFPELAPNATTLVPDNPFAAPAPPAQTVRVAQAPESKEAAGRVAAAGQKILAGNPKIGVRPLFITIGGPQPEIFHRDTQAVFITEGLVKQCATEPQLVAVLCHELGKIISEREAVAGPMARSSESEPPIDLRVGNDSGGVIGAADLTRLAELGKYEKQRRRAVQLQPDPQALARTYLTNAGYAAAELDAAEPLLRAAAQHSTFEKQLGPSAPDRPWVR